MLFTVLFCVLRFNVHAYLLRGDKFSQQNRHNADLIPGELCQRAFPFNTKPSLSDAKYAWQLLTMTFYLVLAFMIAFIIEMLS